MIIRKDNAKNSPREEARPGRRVCRSPSTMIAFYVTIIILYTSSCNNNNIIIIWYAYMRAHMHANTLGDQHHVSTGCIGCHLNIIIYYYVCRTTDPRYYYYSYNTRGIQRRAAVRRPRADWLPLQRSRRVTPADLHTIYITRARTREIARPIIIYYNVRTGNTGYLLDYTAAAADTCPRLGWTCTIIFDNAFLTHHISDDCSSRDVVCIRLLLCSFVAEKS